MLHPHPPGFLRDVLEDALSEIAGIRRLVEAGRLALEHHAIHHSRHDSFPDRLISNVLIGAGRPIRAGRSRSYHKAEPSRTRASPRQRATSGVITRSKCV